MEFPGCIATGDSASTTVTTLEEVARSWLAAALAHGQNIPDPIENSNDFSGRLLLRIPKSLHKKAAMIAEREGVSLNNFVTTSLSESVGERNRVMTNTFTSSSAFLCPPCSQAGQMYSMGSINILPYPEAVVGHIAGNPVGTAGYSGTASHFATACGLTTDYLGSADLSAATGYRGTLGYGGTAAIGEVIGTGKTLALILAGAPISGAGNTTVNAGLRFTSGTVPTLFTDKDSKKMRV